MGVISGWTRMLAAASVSRCHVLLIELPGGQSERIATEREVRRRGWVPATAPTDADVLCLCGPDASALNDLVERVWAQLPGPRARTAVRPGDEVGLLLDVCVEQLRDDDLQIRLDGQRPSAVPEEGDRESHGDDTDTADMDMDMPMPGGIPLAEGGTDRDGLEMDVLSVPIGPVLPLWPAGLVVRCRLQGDVVVDATAEFLGGEPKPASDVAVARLARDVIVQRLDQAATLLTLAGAEPAAARLVAVRDAVLDGAPLADCRGRLTREGNRLRRSVLLRRCLRGVGTIGAPELAAMYAHGATGLVTDLAGSDAWSRLLTLVDAAAGAGGEPAGRDGPAQRLTAGQVTALLPALLGGQDLAGLRLTVASLDVASPAVRPLTMPGEAAL